MAVVIPLVTVTHYLVQKYFDKKDGFVANKNDVTIDFLNWLQKKMPELNNMQFIYDPTETFSVGSDFTIVLAEG